jgi:CDP-glucose 4,6-dehydratase
MLNSNKAKKEISWRPKLNFNDTMKLTVDWYKSFYKKENLESITKKQIEFFLKK